MFLCHVMEYIHVHMRRVQRNDGYRSTCTLYTYTYTSTKAKLFPPLLPNEDNPFNQAGRHIIIMAYMQFNTSYMMLLYIGMYIHTYMAETS